MKGITVLSMTLKPTEEVIDFFRGKNTDMIRVHSYTAEDGVIWAGYDKDHRLIGKCDATGAEQK